MVDAIASRSRPGALSICATADYFDVPYPSLWGRLAGRTSILERHPSNCLLTEDQEDTLYLFIRDLQL